MTFRLGASYYRRGLDNTLVRLQRVPGGATPWTTKRLTNAPVFFDELRSELADLPGQARSPRSRRLAELALEGLENHYEDDALAFQSTIGPVPIVPPNHSRSVVFPSSTIRLRIFSRAASPMPFTESRSSTCL